MRHDDPLAGHTEALDDPPLDEGVSVAGPRPPAPPARRRRRLLVIVLVLVALLGSGIGYAGWAVNGSGNGRAVPLVVPQGASALDIAGLLAERGVVRAPWLFRLYLRWKAGASDLLAGEYRLRTGMSYGDVLAALRKGPPPPPMVRVTIPEGKTVDETAAIVAARSDISERELLRAASSGRHRAEIMPEGLRNLEGFLFPKTYEFDPKKADADAVVARLVAQFDRETAGVDWSRARRLGITPYEAVVLASLIEREAKVAEERTLISAVIHNRLRRGMRLQIDATVQYAIRRKTGSYKSRLTFADYEIASKYNTYRIDGLPPAPIASPGIEAINAALNPADVDYLYYVLLDPGGKHGFAETYQEFLRLRRRAGLG